MILYNIAKVEINYKLFIENVTLKDIQNGLLYNFDDLKKNKKIYNFIKINYSNVLEMFKNHRINAIVICIDEYNY